MKILNIKSKSLAQAGFWAYILIILSTISGLIIGPFILKHTGENMFGVYSTMASFSATLSVVDIGVTQTLMRYIAKYRSDKKDIYDIGSICRSAKYINNFIVILALAMSVFLALNIENIYAHSFSVEEITTAKSVFLLLALSLVVNLASNFYTGIISGYGYFTYIQIVKTIRILSRILLVLIAISVTSSVILVAAIDVILSMMEFSVDRIFVRKNIIIPKNVSFVKKTIFIEMAVYTVFVFLQSMIDQVNSNLDNIIIGALVGPVAVVTYSFSLTIFHMFQQLSTSISQMLLPYMAEKIGQGATPCKLEDSLISIGRVQFVIAGAAICIFATIGKGFVNLWLGEGYDMVWSISLVLMLGGLIPLVQNGAIAILRAKNLMVFRSISLFVMALINAIATFYLVRDFGFQYAAVATSFGFILVNFFIMNIYYYKKLNLNLFRVLWHIVKNIGPCNVPAVLITYFVYNLFDASVFATIASSIVYMIIYSVTLWLIALSIDEKDRIRILINNLITKRNE